MKNDEPVVTKEWRIIMKKAMAILLSLAMVITLIPTIAFAGAQPSDWAKEEVQTAADLGLTTPASVKDYTKNITREEFCELVVNMYNKAMEDPTTVTENPFKDTENPYVLKAYKLGIVKGVSSTSFAPDNSITRQEICTMLIRAYKIMDCTVEKPSGVYIFTDSSKIADWAFESVQIAYDRGIMKGIGDNKIDPLGKTTCEQSILLILRLFNRVTGEPEEEEGALELEFTTVTDDNSVYNGKEKVVDSYFEEISIQGKSKAASKINSEIAVMKQKYIDRLMEIKEIRKERPEDMFNYVNTVSSEVIMNEDGFFSVKFTWDWYGGGVFNEDIVGVTYSTKTGEMVDISEALDMSEEYALDYVSKEIGKYIEENKDYGWNDSAMEIIEKMECCDYKFYMDADNVYITFETYELADGASGSIVIPVKR